MNCEVKRLTLSDAALAVKIRGSLSPPAALSCGAPPPPGEGGYARCSLASVVRIRRGKSALSRVRCVVS